MRGPLVIQPRFARQTMVCFAIPSAGSPAQQTAKPASSCLKIKNQNHTRLVLACHPQISSSPGFCGNATPLTARIANADAIPVAKPKELFFLVDTAFCE
jgi:hypothetical protein